MSILVRNISVEQTVDDLATPVHPSGRFYRFEMICDDDTNRVYDDSVSGLLDHLIAGYSDLPESAKLDALIKHALDSQVRLQARLNIFFDQIPRTPEEEAVLVGPRHVQPEVDVWSSVVPLVLVDAFYAPFSGLARPVSGDGDVAFADNIWWLTPAAGEMAYLVSLNEASLITLNVSSDVVY